MGVGAFVKGLCQISSFFSSKQQSDIQKLDRQILRRYRILMITLKLHTNLQIHRFDVGIAIVVSWKVEILLTGFTPPVG